MARAVIYIRAGYSVDHAQVQGTRYTGVARGLLMTSDALRCIPPCPSSTLRLPLNTLTSLHLDSDSWSSTNGMIPKLDCYQMDTTFQGWNHRNSNFCSRISISYVFLYSLVSSCLVMHRPYIVQGLALSFALMVQPWKLLTKHSRQVKGASNSYAESPPRWVTGD